MPAGLPGTAQCQGVDTGARTGREGHQTDRSVYAVPARPKGFPGGPRAARGGGDWTGLSIYSALRGCWARPPLLSARPPALSPPCHLLEPSHLTLASSRLRPALASRPSVTSAASLVPSPEPAACSPPPVTTISSPLSWGTRDPGVLASGSLLPAPNSGQTTKHQGPGPGGRSGARPAPLSLSVLPGTWSGTACGGGRPAC